MNDSEEGTVGFQIDLYIAYQINLLTLFFLPSISKNDTLSLR